MGPERSGQQENYEEKKLKENIFRSMASLTFDRN